MKNKYWIYVAAAMVIAFAASAGLALDQKTDRAIVPLSNPAAPALIKAEILMGGIIVKGYAGKEVIVEARVRERRLSEDDEDLPEKREELESDDEEREDKTEKIADLKRISISNTGLNIEESENVVAISAESWKYAVDLTIQAPSASSLELRSTNDGDVLVDGISGEINANNVNGSITLRSVSGNVIAHTVNGDITVAMTRVSPDKPMSFSAMNGDIDVTLPADAKASLKMKSQHGDVYSDFDVTVKQIPQKAETAEKQEKGKYRISFDKFITGVINGGGPEYVFNTFNGDIFIRKLKSERLK